MNEIIFTVKVNGACRKARILGFTTNSLKLDLEGQVVFLTRTMFNIWGSHPEIDLRMSVKTLRSGTEVLFLD